MLGGVRGMGRTLLLLCGLFAFGLLVVTSGGGGPTGNRRNEAVDSENSAAGVNKLQGDRAKRTSYMKTKRDNSGMRKPQNPHVFPDDHYRRLLHFVQVTDVHVSMYKAPNRISDFASFINDTLLKIIKPPVVIISGDIVDSLGPSYMSSDQNLDEWVTYRKVLDESQVTKKLQWLDIRGNHDNLNLASLTSPHNLYRTYSEKGRLHKHSYNYIYEQGDEKIAFVGIDTCMDPGSRRPFNFFGQLTTPRFNELLNIKEQTFDANYTIWFGHHPSAVVFGRDKQGAGMRSIFANSGPYLCGHYHTVFNLIQHMYSMHENNALELELGDFKENRKFRVISIDHGLLNFVDVTFKKFPIILVTNPKNALFHLPTYEPIERIRKSTHIRALVFSDEPIIEVKVSLDGAEDIYLTQVDKSSLFVAPWKPMNYAQGLHTLRITADDGLGRSNSVSFEFSLDGSRPRFDTLGVIALYVSQQFFFLILLAILVIIIGPLIVLRIRYTGPSGYGVRNVGGTGVLWSRSRGDRSTTGTSPCSVSCNGKNSCIAFPCYRFLFQLTLLVSIDRLFYPLIAFPIYLCIGPWFLGAIVEEHLGICFLWGTFVDGSFIPGGIIFFYAILLLLVYYIPFVVLLSSRVHTTYAAHFHTVGNSLSTRVTAQSSGSSTGGSVEHRQVPGASGRIRTFLSPLLRNLRAFSLLALIAFQLLWASWFWFAFSWISVVFGFVPTGGLVFTAVLWRMASVLPRSLFCRSATTFTHRDGMLPSQAAAGLSPDPVNNNRLINSSPLSPPTEGSAAKRTIFKDDNNDAINGQQYLHDREDADLLLSTDQVKLAPKMN